MPSLSTLTRASLALTLTGVPSNAETLTLGGKVYTFQTTLTNVDGNIQIGADELETAANIIAAVNLGAGAGTAYAAATTANPHVYAENGGAGVVNVVAKVPGVIGNYVPVAEGMTNATFAGGGTVLANGAGHVFTAIAEILLNAQLNSDVEAVLKNKLSAMEG